MSFQKSYKGKSTIPPWIQAEKVSIGEKIEISFFKFVAFFPVLITFGLLTYLISFFSVFYLYPCLIGDFKFLGLPNLWETPHASTSFIQEKNQYWRQAVIEGCLFIFSGLMVTIAIIQTIITSPGGIPQAKEWDIATSDTQSDMSDDDNKSQKSDEGLERVGGGGGIDLTASRQSIKKQEIMMNEGIQEDKVRPKEPSHTDYKYLNTEVGPMTQEPVKKTFLEQQREDEENEKQQLIKEQKRKAIIKYSYERKKMGGIRMCQRCLRTKPDRCHHCSQCNKCVLKMDHHCPWVSNCIGFYNYKYFLNMLFYTSFTSMQVVFISYPLVQVALQDPNVNYQLAYYILTTYILTLALCFVVTGFFCFHIYLLCHNSTTIEFCEKRSELSAFKISPYDLKCYKNFTTVLGNNILLWFVPFFRNLDGNGILFELNPDLLKGYENQSNLDQENQQYAGF